MSIEIVNDLILKTKELDIKETLKFLYEIYPRNVVFSSSLGQEDQVITDLIAINKIPISIFTLDTGRLFQETYDVLHQTNRKYHLKIKNYFPSSIEVEKLLNDKGPNSFYDSVANRKECCFIRKVAPLKRALQGYKIWITGLRAEQSESRHDLNFFEYDESFNIIKYNPLLKWSLQEVQDYLDKHHVPQNSLHKKGFISIGCAPCTKAISEGEDIRAGRWYWEVSKKECGLHLPARD